MMDRLLWSVWDGRAGRQGGAPYTFLVLSLFVDTKTKTGDSVCRHFCL